MKEFTPLFKNHRFVYLWSSQILSQMTIQIMNFLLLVRLFTHTGSTIATSFLWISYALPAILVGPIASASVDMLSRKKVLMWTNLLQALVIFLYAMSQETSVFLLYGVVVAYSFLNQFYVPAEQSALPSVVTSEHLAYANGLFFMTQQAALIVGFALAGPLYKILGYGTTLLICSGFLFAAFLSVTRLSKMPARETIPENFEKALAQFFEKIISGYNFIKQERYVLYPFLLLIFLQVALAIMMINTPAIVTHIFAIPLEYIGSHIIVPAGLGAGLSAYLIPRLLKKGERKIKLIKSSLLLISASLLLITFLLPLLETALRIVVGASLMAVMGFAFVGVLIPSQTFLQEKTPGGFRGRVFGNFWFIVQIATIFPVLISGTLTELFGIRMLIFFLNMCFLAIFVFVNQKKQLFPVNGYANL